MSHGHWEFAAEPVEVAASGGAESAGARRVVLVVSDALAERLDEALIEACLPRAQVRVVPAFLNALGELGKVDEAAAVIAPIEALAGMVATGAQTLRQLAPHARLLVVANGAERAEAQRALEYGFDAIVDDPIDRAGLFAAWHGRQRDSGDSGSDRSDDGASSGDGAAITPVEAVEVGEVGDTAETGEASDAPSSPEPAPPTRKAATPSLPDAPDDSLPALAASLMNRPALPPTTDEAEPAADVADGDLGDVDLVEAILGGHGRLERVAMRLLRARSQMHDADLAAPGETLPTPHAFVAVSYADHAFGTLHAPPPAREDHLAAWAAWLGRWLALERQIHQLEQLSMRDELTGLWNRRYFNRFLEQVLTRAARDRSHVTLLVFDIDDFKLYNDRYGHAAGDEILRETARLMTSAVREHDVVARIGGDEFAVIFWDAEQKRRADSHHPESVRKAARRFQQGIYQHRFPKLLDEAPGTLTISGGLASFPWDGRTPQELLEKADEMAMQSKRQGKNAITFGPGALGQGEG